MLEQRAALPNRSPILEARIRANNKKIEECKQSQKQLAELYATFVANIVVKANEHGYSKEKLQVMFCGAQKESDSKEVKL